MTHPRFADINHPALAPDWLKTGLDDIYDRFPLEEISSLGFSFWVNQYHDDNNSYSTHADFFLRLTSKTGEEAQSILDQIPAIRRLERRAKELWYLLPISYDDEASVLGEPDHEIKPGLLEFKVTDEDNDLAEMRMVAEFKDGAWHCYDEITFYQEISETLRLTATPERLAEAIDLTSLGFTEEANAVKVIGGEIDENDAIVLRFEPGLFRHYTTEGERE